MKYNGVINRNNNKLCRVKYDCIYPALNLAKYFKWLRYIDSSEYANEGEYTVNGLTEEGVAWLAEATPYKEAGELIIPRVIGVDGGVKIVADINNEAFKGNTDIKKVTLSEGITRIRQNAFEDCTNLTTVKCSKSLKALSGGAFSGCTALVDINLPEGLTHIYNYVFLSVYKFGNAFFTKYSNHFK